MYFDPRTYDRFCAAFRYASDDTWGLVGQLERQFDLPRNTIYRDVARIRAALEPKRPGPKPDLIRPWAIRLERLEADHAVLQARVRTLEEQLSRSVEVTPERIEDLILTAVTTPPSYVGVGEYVRVAFGEGYRPSVGKVSDLVTRFGHTAGQILTEPAVTDLFEEGCPDELFAGRRPVLTLVEPASLAIGAVEVSDSRAGEDWQVVLERFVHLRYVASDLGTGLKAGIGLCPQIRRQQPDFWHLIIRPLSHITRRLEANLEKTWEQERQAIIQHQRPKGQGKLYAPSLVRLQQEVADQFDRMERYYQGIEHLFEAFDPIVDEPGAPRLRQPEEAQALLTRALEAFHTVADAKLEEMMEKLETHRRDLFHFLDQLHEQLVEIPLEGVEDPHQAEILRNLVVSEILLSRQRQHASEETVVAAYQNVWEQIGQLGPLQKYYPAWRTTIAACLYQPRRTSSLVETINSPLRTLQQIHRNLSQSLLDLYALRHNMTPFGNGCRRRGISPYQRLGVDLGTDDWLEALRTYRKAS
jgi:hypothetical protein